MPDPNPEAWPCLRLLSELVDAGDKEQQRRLLRLHEEAGFDEDDRGPINFRIALDAELARISDAEFLAQCSSEQPAAEAVPYFADLLRKSPAFVQYLNVYLYFNVRFAAYRMKIPRRAVSEATDCNEPIVELPNPPMCQNGWDNASVPEEFLRLARDSDYRSPVLKALRFLDGFSADDAEPEPRKAEENEELQFELWFKRLYFKEAKQRYFADLADALSTWAENRYQFYVSLERRNSAERTGWVNEWERQSTGQWTEGLWTVTNPIAARCALVDFYWLAKILRADVSQNGVVSYRSKSWLYLLAVHAEMGTDLDARERAMRKSRVLQVEEVLRSVFGYACDVIQNAVEIAIECAEWEAHREKFPFPPAAISDRGRKTGEWRPESWREVEDLEHAEINAHRKERDQKSRPPRADSLCPDCAKPAGWSRRVWSGEYLDNGVGLCFSGGGIRSATFNLGVLQKLQELDLLRKVDYLSTVSGGGYIGSWLVGNVRRTRYWLSRMTNWDASIEHLRRYSNYLAPRTGILSADTWSIGLTWVRNAFLVQLTAFVWFAVLLTFTLNFKRLAFESAQDGQANPGSTPHWVLLAAMILIGATLVFFLLQERIPRSKGIARSVFAKGNAAAITAASVAWLACFITAGLLWGQVRAAPGEFTSFGAVLKNAVAGWSHWILAAFCGCIASIAILSSRKLKARKIEGVVLSALLTPALAYLALCGELRVFGAISYNALTQSAGSLDRVDWIAFTIGPFLSMIGIAASIAVFIGLIGRAAPDWTREWWTRYGAWIAMIGTSAFLVMAAAVLAPWGVLQLPHLKWTAISGAVTWVGSTIGGLLAGKSSKTGEGGQRSQLLEIIARAGGFLFIVGAAAVSSTLVFAILREAIGDDAQSYAANLRLMVSHSTGASPFPLLWVVTGALIILGIVCSRRFDLNTFSLNQFYRNRLVRCYLGATRWQPELRHQHPFTGFDQKDDILLSDLRALKLSETGSPDAEVQDRFCGELFRGPFPIINCTLNLGGSSDLSIHTRQSASFSLTPLFCGSSRRKVGYASTPENAQSKCFAGGVRLGEAISVSGAAASPNMGYNTSPLVSFLMTLFNVRLGWWFPNPAFARSWFKDRPPSGIYLTAELFGIANEDRGFVNVSDGGHFENLGVYELIRRRARVIIASDAECDETLTFGSLGNLVRIVETDFGAKIDLDVLSIRKDGESERSKAHCAVGKITYSNGTHGWLIYLKSSITGDEDIGIAQYRSGHPTFPHESTGNQFYSEDQFEAYRRLGYHVADRAFRDAANEVMPVEIAAKLYDIWAPAGFNTDSFLQHTGTLNKLLDGMRADASLLPLFSELTGGGALPTNLSAAEDAACMEVIQLMENVFLDLRLDEFWQHPDNRGWVFLFSDFARSPKLQQSWNRHRSTYGIRFEYFCSQKLGLDRDRPILRA